MASLHVISIISIGLGLVSALWLSIGVLRQPDKMMVMNFVWPLVGLFGGPLAIWLRHRHAARGHAAPFAVMTAVATCHCGAGCSLGDLTAESILLAAPGVAGWFGLGSIWSNSIFAGWSLDFLLAYLFGIIFQFFSIAPMRGLNVKDGILAALKADTLSLIAWQTGMYGAMALVQFGWAMPVRGAALSTDGVEFWFSMQAAMLAGFAVSYPVNWWLLKAGLKEKM